MSRKARYALCGALIGLLLVYIVAAYVSLEWNPLAFSEGGRITFTVFALLFMWAGGMSGDMIGDANG